MLHSPSKTANHESFLAYKNYRYLKVSLLICFLSIIGYFTTDFTPNRNGGTWYGYSLGTIAALLILWLALLGIRKRVISKGSYSLKSWTSAHVYLGLSLIITATLHTGFQFGWNIHTLAYSLMIFVVISGIFGIYFYAFTPRKMSKNRGEMGQLDMLEALAGIDKILGEAALSLDDNLIKTVQNSIYKTKLGGGFILRVRGRRKKCPTVKALTVITQALGQALPETRPTLLNTISILERKNALLVRIRRHMKYKALLNGWLYIHIPVTFALIAALIAHIISVFYYS